jgi:uncharacterized protein with von Willebrand factor type A (vWA) domain
MKFDTTLSIRSIAAKQVALALSELISRDFPKDYIVLIVFGDDAKLMSLNEFVFVEYIRDRKKKFGSP